MLTEMAFKQLKCSARMSPSRIAVLFRRSGLTYTDWFELKEEKWCFFNGNVCLRLFGTLKPTGKARQQATNSLLNGSELVTDTPETGSLVSTKSASCYLYLSQLLPVSSSSTPLDYSPVRMEKRRMVYTWTMGLHVDVAIGSEPFGKPEITRSRDR